MGLGSSSGRLSRATVSQSCREIVKSSGCATWRGDQEGSQRHCGLIVGLMGSICAEKALHGSDAVITNPAKSGIASGSASRGMRTASCDFIFGAVRSSAVQDRLGNKGPYQAVVVRVLSFALASGSAHSNRSNKHLVRREIHCYSVDAITQMGRCGALVKNLPEITSTTCAMNFGPDASVSPASCLDANVTGYYHRLPLVAYDPRVCIL